ncbi:MAG: carbohydrate kinase family protein [Euryarchaeota archaeon]|nr:carbohydrate kinase family protein [Euryarchaeota archaeon]
MKKFDVITIGAVLADQIGYANKLPERDEEIFVSNLIMRSGGSAANTAVACSRLGLRTGFVGKIGSDSLGDMLLNDLKTEGVDTSQIKRTKEKPTGTCIVIIDKDNNRHMYAFSGAANFLTKNDINENYVLSSKIVHLADLKNIDPLEKAAKIASSKVKVSLNPGGLIIGLGYKKIKKLLSLTDIYISSKSEAEALYGTNSTQKLIDLLLQENIEIVALTLGPDGCIVANSKERYKISSYNVKVVDTTGAGDAFSAGFIYGLIKKFPLKKCGEYGNATATLCITTLGARFQHSKKEVENIIRGKLRKN